MRHVPIALQNKLDKMFQTIAENANPSMLVSVARSRSSIIDTSYFVVETIREKAGLGEVAVAVRRQIVDYSPDQIFEVHLDNGIAKTAYRAYPDKLKAGWQNGITLEAAQSVAIAFDGNWVRDMYHKWQMVTDEFPWIFWVTTAGMLKAQIWHDATSLVQIASADVVKCVALRGWKSTVIPTDDQGIVVAYIKTDGTVWYSGYCRQSDGTTVWEVAREVTDFTGSAVSVNLFLTNDYRLGFAIEDSTGAMYWYITTRCWGGMAIESDTILAMLSASIDFVEIKTTRMYEGETITPEVSCDLAYLWGQPYVEVTSLANIDDGNGDYGLVIRMDIDQQLNNLSLSEVMFMDEWDTGYVVENLINNGDHVLFYVSDFNNAYGDMRIVYTRTVTTNDAGYAITTLNGINSFTPTGLDPVPIDPPTPVDGWNE